jgi:hypothetical protein
MKHSIIFSFALSIFISMIIVTGCIKDKNTSTNNTGNNNKMGGIRKWHRSQNFIIENYAVSGANDSTYNLPDTSFTLNIINDSTINIFGYTLISQGVIDTNASYPFICYVNASVTGAPTLDYYTGADSMVFSSGYWANIPGGAEFFGDLYYTYK